MMYSWKYSAVLLGLVGGAFLIAPWPLFFALGRIIATVTDLRFLIPFILAAVFAAKASPLILGLVVGVVRSAYLQFTLQDHWARLQIPSPNPFDTFWAAFLGALVLFSLWHVVVGVWRAATTRLAGENPREG